MACMCELEEVSPSRQVNQEKPPLLDTCSLAIKCVLGVGWISALQKQVSLCSLHPEQLHMVALSLLVLNPTHLHILIWEKKTVIV